MNKSKLQIYHLYHSGVAVELNDELLIFDYYKDTEDIITNNKLKNKDEVYVFVSHSHGDHYNPQILEWEKKVNNIQYILSEDIRERNKGDNYHFVNKYEKKLINNIELNTFGSTDRGVSFYVKNENVKIFHSGDLNWWHWKNNSKDKQKQEEKNFKKEIDKIKKKVIDIAFVPVDPRLDEFYYLAGEYFIREVKPQYFVPIHFGDCFEITKTFASKVSDSGTRIISINKRGQIISI